MLHPGFQTGVDVLINTPLLGAQAWKVSPGCDTRGQLLLPLLNSLAPHSACGAFIHVFISIFFPCPADKQGVDYYFYYIFIILPLSSRHIPTCLPMDQSSVHISGIYDTFFKLTENTQKYKSVIGNLSGSQQKHFRKPGLNQMNSDSPILEYYCILNSIR